MIEERLLKYVPKKLWNYVTVLYKHSDNAYTIYLEIDSVTYCGLADGVNEIRYAANYMFNNHENYQM